MPLRGAWPLLAAALLLLISGPPAHADVVHLKGGAAIEADEVWESADGVWFRRGGVTEFVSRQRVERVERVTQKSPAEAGGQAAPAVLPAHAVWIYLTSGARMQVEEAAESAEGVWYRHGNLSALIPKERVVRVVHAAAGVEVAAVPSGVRRVYQWTTGRPALDSLIKESAARHELDPYLIFCVMEHESHFNPKATSPAGARGLMQLMPATARRLGVRRIFDPAQNVEGGVKYLKQLVGMFGARLDLVLAGYNAGEGAVMKYGQRVPPYSETRNYVRRISARYGAGTAASASGQ